MTKSKNTHYKFVGIYYEATHWALNQLAKKVGKNSNKAIFVLPNLVWKFILQNLKIIELEDFSCTLQRM